MRDRNALSMIRLSRQHLIHVLISFAAMHTIFLERSAMDFIACTFTRTLRLNFLASSCENFYGLIADTRLTVGDALQTIQRPPSCVFVWNQFFWEWALRVFATLLSHIKTTWPPLDNFEREAAQKGTRIHRLPNWNVEAV